MALIAEGRSEPSMADVAERAGVALRTVYRHFADRDAVVAGVNQEIEERVGVRKSAPSDLDQLLDRAREMFAAYVEHEVYHRAAQVSPDSRKSRMSQAPRRRAWIAGAIEPTLDGLGPDDARRLVALLRAVLSSQTLFTMVDYGDVDAEEAIHALAWAVRALVEAAARDGEVHG